MDPITCLGIASALVQFVDFGTKLISEAKELYTSAHGASAENFELESVTSDLSQLSKKLSLPASGQQVPDDERELRKVAVSCKEVANELLEALQDIKLEGAHRKWQSFRQALRSVMKKEKIQNISARLERLQKQVQLRLISILSQRQSNVLSLVEGLAQESTRLQTKTTGRLDELTTELANGIAVLSRQQAMTTMLLQDISTQMLSKLSDIEAEKKRIETSLKLLNSLHFKSMSVRLSNVKEHHAETFQWIFERHRDETYQKPSFLQWLEDSGGIYWVSGKAGSGKSTLMKYLWYHKYTQNALQAWAGPNKLTTAMHFFWNAGNNKMQMSQIGLLRSLLYQILRECPELIIDVCTETEDCSDQPTSTWTLQSLLKAFERLIEQTIKLAELSARPIEENSVSLGQRIRPIKICLFIDGLDEYEGNPIEIIQLFKKYTTSKTIKICLSSRPWNVFENAFGTDTERKLMLQDLTRNDIQIYVYDKLGEHSQFRSLAKENQQYEDLIQKIVNKAEGVFLWVYLIVQSLLNGLEDGNDLHELQRRVDLLPSDLMQCFMYMLKDVDEVYRSETAQILQMCLCCRSPLPVSTVMFLKAERDNPDYAIAAKTESQTLGKLKMNRIEMKRYLNARTKGLLEINVDVEKSFSFQYKVDFLHRTVKDFLKTEEMQDMLQAQVSRGFDVNTSLCRASLAQIKCLQPAEISSSDTGALSPWSQVLTSQMRDLMSYAKEVEIHHSQTETAILDELDRFLALRTTTRPFSRTMSGMSDWEEVRFDSLEEMFLAWAIEAGLYLYVEQKLKARPSLLQPLLTYTTTNGFCCGYMDQDPRNLSVFLSSEIMKRKDTGHTKETMWQSFIELARRKGVDFVMLLEVSAKFTKQKAHYLPP